MSNISSRLKRAEQQVGGLPVSCDNCGIRLLEIPASLPLPPDRPCADPARCPAPIREFRVILPPEETAAC